MKSTASVAPIIVPFHGGCVSRFLCAALHMPRNIADFSLLTGIVEGVCSDRHLSSQPCYRPHSETEVKLFPYGSWPI